MVAKSRGGVITKDATAERESPDVEAYVEMLA
jgi:hypothetical protein